MGPYMGSGSAAAGTSKAILNLHNAAGAPRSRAYLSDIVMGSVTTPADNATQMRVVRTTALGTEGSGFTPVPLDPATPASEWDFGVGAYSVEPTKGSQLLLVSFNQRNTFRFIAKDRHEFIAPATQNAGLCLESVSSTATPTIDSTMEFSE